MRYMKLIPQLKMIFSWLFIGLFTVAKLIGCEIEDLKLTFSTRKMKVGNDNIVQKLTVSQVNDFSVNMLGLLYIEPGVRLFCNRTEFVSSFFIE